MQYWRRQEDEGYRPPRWTPPYEPSPHGERFAHLEAAIANQREVNDRQREINGSLKSRISSLEQAQRRSEQMARLKAARKAARRDVIKTVQWVVSILATVAYVGHLVISGQWLGLLRFVLGLDS